MQDSQKDIALGQSDSKAQEPIAPVIGKTTDQGQGSKTSNQAPGSLIPETAKSEPEQTKKDKPWLFKPGQSGNPKGRPPAAKTPRSILVEKLEYVNDEGVSNKDAIVDELIFAARMGKRWAIELVFGYTDGKPSQSLHLEAAIEARINTLSDEQLKKIAEEYLHE